MLEVKFIENFLCHFLNFTKFALDNAWLVYMNGLGTSKLHASFILPDKCFSTLLHRRLCLL